MDVNILRTISKNSIKEIHNIASKEGITNYSIKCKPLSKEMENCYGTFICVEIGGERNGDSVTINLIVKFASRDEKMRMVSPVARNYTIEIMVYEKIFPAFFSLEKRNKLKDEDKLCVPRYYCSQLQYVEYLIMEDVTQKGFAVLNNFDFNYELFATNLKSLAEFHALSFALKVQDRGLFENLAKVSIELTNKDDPVKVEYERRFFQLAATNAMSAIEDPLLRSKLERSFAANAFDRIMQCYVPDEHAVFCHGDFHLLNVMLKYQDQKLTQLCLIDFQYLKLSSPATDILYFLIKASTKQFRAEHYEQLLHHYHTSLSNHLVKFSIDVDSVYTYNALLQDLKRCCAIALHGVSLKFFHLTVDREKEPDYFRKIYCREITDWPRVEGKQYEEQRKKVHDAVQDLVDYGYM